MDSPGLNHADSGASVPGYFLGGMDGAGFAKRLESMLVLS
jgi:hypothetical protein